MRNFCINCLYATNWEEKGAYARCKKKHNFIDYVTGIESLMYCSVARKGLELCPDYQLAPEDVIAEKTK